MLSLKIILKTAFCSDRFLRTAALSSILKTAQSLNSAHTLKTVEQKFQSGIATILKTARIFNDHILATGEFCSSKTLKTVPLRRIVRTVTGSHALRNGKRFVFVSRSKGIFLVTRGKDLSTGSSW